MNAGMGRKRIEALAIDPTDGRNVYASTTDIYEVAQGLFRSADGGATWTAANNGLPRAVIRALAVDPLHPQNVFAGTDVGLFKSTDWGRSWNPSGRGLAGFKVNDLELARQDAASIYVATSDRGVHATHDAGGTWAGSNAGLTEQRTYALAIDHTDARVAYVGTWSGVSKSRDGATSWQSASGGLPTTGILSLAMDSVDPQALFAVVAGRALFKTADGGQSWAGASTGVTAPHYSSWVMADPSNAGVAYLFCSVLYKTSNGGGTWDRLEAPNWSYQTGAVAPSDSARIWLAGTQLARSSDGGATWQILTNPLGFAGGGVTALAIDPVDPRIVYLGTEWSGVLVTVDDGASWMPLNPGLMNKNVTALAIDRANPRDVYAGTAGTGVFKLTRPEQPAIVTRCPISPWVLGRAQSMTLSAIGGTPPYRWSVAAGKLPRGLALAADTGVISGTASSFGDWPMTLAVTDSASARATAACSIRVFSELTVDNQTPFVVLPPGLVGSTYSQRLAASRGVPPYIWSTESINLLGTGLTLNRDGTLSGVLARAGLQGFSVKVRDASGQMVEAGIRYQVFWPRFRQRLQRQ